MTSLIPPDWKIKLNDELQKPYFQELLGFIEKEYREGECFPAPEHIFNAFKCSSFDRTRVVIIGQDPYHGYGQAHGLCFSVQPGTRIPPSLLNIFKERKDDLGIPIPKSGNLAHWAHQGVLMLNATLSVRSGTPKSHYGKGWERFTDAVIEMLSKDKENLVFLLWGGPARKKGKRIDPERHLVLTSGHPSPLAAIRGHWFGNRHFSRTNEYLRATGQTLIDW